MKEFFFNSLWKIFRNSLSEVWWPLVQKESSMINDVGVSMHDAQTPEDMLKSD